MPKEPIFMDKDLYLIHMQQAWILAKIIDDVPIEEMLKLGNDADSMVWFVDPTLALDQAKRKKFEQDRALLRALLSVQHVLYEMKPKGEVTCTETRE